MAFQDQHPARDVLDKSEISCRARDRSCCSRQSPSPPGSS